MKLKIDKEFEVDVAYIRSLYMRGNTITIEMSNARYEITDTSREVTNANEVEDLPKQNPTKQIQSPTKDEVIKTLSEWLKENMPYLSNCKVCYDVGGFYYNDNVGREIYFVDYNEKLRSISFPHYVPLHLIIMICKFYDGLEKEKTNEHSNH